MKIRGGVQAYQKRLRAQILKYSHIRQSTIRGICKPPKKVENTT